MKVAILGTGVVGQALARGFLGLQDEVAIGTRDPASDSARKVADEVPGARVVPFAEAARTCELAVLATAYVLSGIVLRLTRRRPKESPAKPHQTRTPVDVP